MNRSSMLFKNLIVGARYVIEKLVQRFFAPAKVLAADVNHMTCVEDCADKAQVLAAAVKQWSKHFMYTMRVADETRMAHCQPEVGIFLRPQLNGFSWRTITTRKGNLLGRLELGPLIITLLLLPGSNAREMPPDTIIRPTVYRAAMPLI